MSTVLHLYATMFRTQEGMRASCARVIIQMPVMSGKFQDVYARRYCLIRNGMSLCVVSDGNEMADDWLPNSHNNKALIAIGMSCRRMLSVGLSAFLLFCEISSS